MYIKIPFNKNNDIFFSPFCTIIKKIGYVSVRKNILESYMLKHIIDEYKWHTHFAYYMNERTNIIIPPTIMKYMHKFEQRIKNNIRGTIVLTYASSLNAKEFTLIITSVSFVLEDESIYQYATVKFNESEYTYDITKSIAMHSEVIATPVEVIKAKMNIAHNAGLITYDGITITDYAIGVSNTKGIYLVLIYMDGTETKTFTIRVTNSKAIHYKLVLK